MKIAISATGRGNESNIDPIFHRCSFFLIFDTKANTFKALKNTAKDRPSEVGAIVGQIVANEGIGVVITTDIGPRAFEIFERYGIKVYRAEGLIEDAFRQLEKGKLPEITKPTRLKYSAYTL